MSALRLSPVRPERVTLRPGGADDYGTAFEIYARTTYAPHELVDHDLFAARRERNLPVQRHLAATADRFWIAERGGRPVGMARSILRDRVRELTELFVLPEAQGLGLGSELLERALPREAGVTRTVIAIQHPAAQTLYMRAGLEPRFPILRLRKALADGAGSAAAPPPFRTGLTAQPLPPTERSVERIGAIDARILGYRRDAEHRWLLARRSAVLYLRDDVPAGYAYLGRDTGPVALLDEGLTGDVLAHLEVCARADGGPLELQVPGVNRRAIAWLLARGYRLDPFRVEFMSDRPIGDFARYLHTRPMFFV